MTADAALAVYMFSGALFSGVFLAYAVSFFSGQ